LKEKRLKQQIETQNANSNPTVSAVTATLHREGTVCQPRYALTVSYTLDSILAGSKPKDIKPKLRLCKLISCMNSQKPLKQRGSNTRAQNKGFLYCTYDTHRNTPKISCYIIFATRDIVAFLMHDAQSILLFSTKYHSFHNFIFLPLAVTFTFYIQQRLEFKYPPHRIKVVYEQAAVSTRFTSSTHKLNICTT